MFSYTTVIYTQLYVFVILWLFNYLNSLPRTYVYSGLGDIIIRLFDALLLDVTSSRVTACGHAGRQAISCWLHKPVSDWLETLPQNIRTEYVSEIPIGHN